MANNVIFIDNASSVASHFQLTEVQYHQLLSLLAQFPISSLSNDLHQVAIDIASTFSKLSSSSCDKFSTKFLPLFFLLLIMIFLHLIHLPGYLILILLITWYILSLFLQPLNFFLLPLSNSHGHNVTVTHTSTIKISKTLIFHDVCCVSAFSFKLISISKLTQSLTCYLIFLPNFYFIQDLIHCKIQNAFLD